MVTINLPNVAYLHGFRRLCGLTGTVLRRFGSGLHLGLHDGFAIASLLVLSRASLPVLERRRSRTFKEINFKGHLFIFCLLGGENHV